MATTTDSSSNRHSPGCTDSSGDNSNNPQLVRSNQLPWAQVVRGEQESVSVRHSPQSSSSSLSSLVASVPEQPFSDCSPSKAAYSSPPPDNNAGETSDANSDNAAPGHKNAWNRPSNGVLEVGPVMGAASWPALSESTKSSPKPQGDSSVKPAADGPVSIPEGPVNAPSSEKHATSNAEANSTVNQTMPSRPRFTKHGGGGSTGAGPSRGSFSHPPQPPPPPPPYPVFQIPPHSYGSLVPSVRNPSPRDPPFMGNNWEPRPIGGFVSQHRPSNDRRNSSRRANFNPNLHGDGTYHNNNGGRWDDRGSYANARDVHMQQQRPPPRGLMRPQPPYAPPFLSPQPRSFGNPMGFPEFVYIVDPYRGPPFMPHPTMILPVADNHPLSTLLVNQIEYYFSDANLVKDNFLRSKMNDQGWVPISLIASFPRVKSLTNDVQLISESLKNSSIVEVQDDKMRRRNQWMKWLPASNQPTAVSLPPNESSMNMLATSFRNITVEEAGSIHDSEDIRGRSPTVLAGDSQLPNGEVTQNANFTD